MVKFQSPLKFQVISLEPVRKLAAPSEFWQKAFKSKVLRSQILRCPGCQKGKSDTLGFYKFDIDVSGICDFQLPEFCKKTCTSPGFYVLKHIQLDVVNSQTSNQIIFWTISGGVKNPETQRPILAHEFQTRVQFLVKLRTSPG